MKKKNEVYVVVDTPKKAKKLQEVLDMFGEKPNEQAKENDNVWRNTYFYFKKKGTYDTAIYEKGCHTTGKTQVSIKELRNILAVEHLKEGDVVVCRNKDNQVEHLFKIDDKDDNIVWYQSRLSNEDGLITQYGSWSLNNFIRYATEEEKALLEPVKIEYKDKTWYKRENGGMFFLDKSKEHHYGFLCGCEWYEEIQWFKNYELNNFHVPGTWEEATTEEVKQALVKEASKRGYERVTYDNGDLFCRLPYSNLEKVYSNGVWKELDKQGDEPFKSIREITDQDIATLERLHDMLHDVHGYSLEFELMKSARVLAEKLRELQKPQCIISGESLKNILNNKPNLEI